MNTQEKHHSHDMLFDEVYFANPVGLGGNYSTEEVLSDLYSNLQIPYLVVTESEDEIYQKMIDFSNQHFPDVKVSKFVFCLGYYEPFKC